jgi:hypothetical protein
MTKYTFKTIVATEQVRHDFTVLRNRLNTTDKLLMQALWNTVVGNSFNMSCVEQELQAANEQNALNKAAKRIKREPKAKKAPKVKKETKIEKQLKAKGNTSTKPTKEKVQIVTTVDEFGKDDVECIVVDGTK